MGRKAKSRAVHHQGQKKVRRYGRKAPGLCLVCYEWVQHLYLTDGVEKCYYCSRGIPNPNRT